MLVEKLDIETKNKIQKIKFLFTDCDGVLTDGGVYYSAKGEEMKRFSVKDGMGVERLRKFADINTGIMTGEKSESVKRRAEKLKIKEVHLDVKDKKDKLQKIIKRLKLIPAEIGYIGDDVNDLEVMRSCGFCACPADAEDIIKKHSDFIASKNGGYGAFRDIAEIIITTKVNNNKERE